MTTTMTTTDNGQFLIRKAHLSLRFRLAKNETKSEMKSEKCLRLLLKFDWQKGASKLCCNEQRHLTKTNIIYSYLHKNKNIIQSKEKNKLTELCLLEVGILISNNLLVTFSSLNIVKQLATTIPCLCSSPSVDVFLIFRYAQINVVGLIQVHVLVGKNDVDFSKYT